MSLSCPACGKPILPADVNIQADLAKCAGCGEVFSPSRTLGDRLSAPHAPPGGPAELPRDSKIVVDEQGGGLVVRFPAQGFNFGLVFLSAFAIAWWSFLFFFVGMALVTGRASGDSTQATAAHATTMRAEPEDAQVPASQPSSADRAASQIAPWFILLFLTPFFLAGFAMIGGILWPLFGRSQVSLDDFECRYRLSLFGLGRTWRASIEDTRLLWRDISDSSVARYMAQYSSMGGGQSRILLTLGRREKAIAGSVSQIEQEWVFNRLSERLRRMTRVRR